MTQEQLFFNIMSLVIMFIPIGVLLWKFGRIVFQVEINKKDINGLRQNLDNKINTFENRFIENETKLGNIELIMARVETKLNLILQKNGLQI
jgi:hypothetical protein